MNHQQIAALIAGVGLFAASAANAHDTLTSMYAPAGYMQDLEMRITHGCKGSPVKEVRIKIPEAVQRVSAAVNRDWTVELKTRKLPKPVPGEGGAMITETVDEIVWKDPKSPIPASGSFEGFKFRGLLPNTPGQMLYFQTVNVCVAGDDKYIDLPKEEIKANAPGLSGTLLKFMMATPGPAPFLILEKPLRPQYPFSAPAAAKPAAAKPAAAGH
jgi:periplasmic copper chaperone A